MSKNIIEQVETLKVQMAKFERISTESAVKLTALLDEAGEDALEVIVRARIKFMWMPALNRLQSKFKWDRKRLDSLLKGKA